MLRKNQSSQTRSAHTKNTYKWPNSSPIPTTCRYTTHQDTSSIRKRTPWESDIAHLRKWSGCLQSLLWAKWYYPTYTTAQEELGHIADVTSLSIRLISTRFGLEFGNGLFLSEDTFRRFDINPDYRKPYLIIGNVDPGKYAETDRAS